MRAVIGGVLAAGLLVSPAFAQSSPGSWNGLSDRFQIDTGYFRISASSVLRYNGAQGSGDVNFEDDLGLDPNVDTFWVDATWRVGRRHKLKLAYTRFNRDRADYTLQNDFTWGGETYNKGLSASTSSGTDIVGGYYRFALFRNDRFEIGPTIGVGYLWLTARIKASGAVRRAALSTGALPRGASPGPWEGSPRPGPRRGSPCSPTSSTSTCRRGTPTRRSPTGEPGPTTTSAAT
jgi:hypothetical protein